MWFENLLVFILFKFKKKHSNISGIRVVLYYVTILYYIQYNKIIIAYIIL